MSTVFDEIDNGETVFIRHNGIVYSLVKLEDDEQTMEDELKRKILKAREEYKGGMGITCNTVEESKTLLEPL